MYLDDWLILAASREGNLRHLEEVTFIAQSLGFILNKMKSSLNPSQSFVFLGMSFDTVSMTVRPSPERLDRFRSRRSRLLSLNETSARSLASLLGQLESLAPLVPMGHVHKRELQRQFHSRWSQSCQAWDVRISLKDWFLPAIRQWTQDTWLEEGVPISFPEAQVELFTDASQVGWGAHVADLTASGRWPLHVQGLHINVLEMMAVVHAVETFVHFLQQKSVCLSTDNTTVACYLNKGGGGSFSNPVSQGRVSPSFLRTKRDCSKGKTCLRKDQHPGRFSESTRDDSTDRMDSLSLCPQRSMVSLVQTDNRSVCHPVQSETSGLCIPSSRSSSSNDRCSGNELGGSLRLRFSSPSDSRKGDQKGKSGPPLSHSGSPSLASSALVPRASRTVSSSATQTKRRKRRVVSAKVTNPTRRPGKVVTSRLASVRQNLRTLGASRHVLDLVSKSHRSGTNAVYSSHWKRWLIWCSANDSSPSDPSEVDLANFLAHLSEENKLSPSSLRVYRAAICTTLRQLGAPSFSDSSLLKDVIRGASLAKAQAPRRLPSWDLFLVLSSLKESPFEPLYSSDLKALTLKTVFLIALASGRRASEICHLSGLCQDIAREQDGSFSLRFLPEFLAKNQSPCDPSPVIRIRPLTGFLCSDDSDRKLCPVRSLKRYVRFTRAIRKNQRKLFISHNPFYSKDITSASISRWLRYTIKQAYECSSFDVCSSRAHEVRAWASSAAFAHSWNLKDVMAAAYWQSETSFINFYLRDISLTRGDGSFGISTFVAAQQVVQTLLP